MSCIINYVLDLSECGQISFMLDSEISYDLFWNIMNRYAKNILNRIEKKDKETLLEFSFEKMIVEYNFRSE